MMDINKNHDRKRRLPYQCAVPAKSLCTEELVNRRFQSFHIDDDSKPGSVERSRLEESQDDDDEVLELDQGEWAPPAASTEGASNGGVGRVTVLPDVLQMLRESDPVLLQTKKIRAPSSCREVCLWKPKEEILNISRPLSSKFAPIDEEEEENGSISGQNYEDPSRDSSSPSESTFVFGGVGEHRCGDLQAASTSSKNDANGWRGVRIDDVSHLTGCWGLPPNTNPVDGPTTINAEPLIESPPAVGLESSGSGPVFRTPGPSVNNSGHPFRDPLQNFNELCRAKNGNMRIYNVNGLTIEDVSSAANPAGPNSLRRSFDDFGCTRESGALNMPNLVQSSFTTTASVAPPQISNDCTKKRLFDVDKLELMDVD